MAKKKVKARGKEAVDFTTAFKFPFNRPAGMLNILWMLVPILGWLMLIGYTVRITKGFVKGDFTELPTSDFGSDLKFGFIMILKFLPFILAIIFVNVLLAFIPVIGHLATLLINLFVVPLLAINFFVKETIESSFELDVVRPVFENLVEYLITLLKSIALALVFMVMMVVLVGIPAGAFTKHLFLADFYRRFVK